MLTLPLGIPLVLIVLAVMATVGWMVWEPLFGPNEPFGQAPEGFRAVDGYTLEGRVRGRAVGVTCTRRGPRRTVLTVSSNLGVPPDAAALRQPQVGELRRQLSQEGRLEARGIEVVFEDGPRGDELRREVERVVELVERYERAALAPWFELAAARGLELLVGEPLILRGEAELYEVKKDRLDALVQGFDKGLQAGAREDFEPVGNPVLDLLIGVSGPWPEGSEEALLAVVHGHPGSTVRDGRLHLLHAGPATAAVLSGCIDDARALRDACT